MIGWSWPSGSASPGNVTSTTSSLSDQVELLARDPVQTRLFRCFQLRPDVIERPSGLAVADLAQRLRERGAAAEVADVDFGELLGR